MSQDQFDRVAWTELEDWQSWLNQKPNLRIKSYPDGTYQYLHVSTHFNVGPRKKSFTSRSRRSSDDMGEHSRSDSVHRSYTHLRDILRCNVWDWFVTLTISSHDSCGYDYDSSMALLRSWLRKVKVDGMYYVFVPELTKRGVYHFHGLIGGVGYDWEEMIPSYRRNGDVRVDSSGRDVYNAVSWPYPITSCSIVGNSVGASLYISKYVTKDLNAVPPGRKRYLCSSGLVRPDTYYTRVDNDDVTHMVADADWVSQRIGFMAGDAAVFTYMTRNNFV